MYDYVIIGAGAAGCVLAARLSENPRAACDGRSLYMPRGKGWAAPAR